MKKTTVLQIFLVLSALSSLVPIGGYITVSNVTATTPLSTSYSTGLLQTLIPLAIAGMIELYKRLKDRGWPNKYKGIIVARPV